MVKAWREIVTIPTYEIGQPEKNPIFLEKRVYQGSSGVVYPYPVIESISDEKTDKDYEAVSLDFTSDGVTLDQHTRYLGFVIRPVLDKE